ncbi:hypothetical protein [Paenibacillus gorillae]|uniref:hypothetical protein n=1 Tax=Paenibacillus gorillae TaxID=1243662 RepID=UPI0004B34A61|nr:hypothetical protein [Paenibacillus gorillae]
MATKVSFFLSFIISIAIAFICGVYFSDEVKSKFNLTNDKTLAYDRNESAPVVTGQKAASDNEQKANTVEEPPIEEVEEKIETSGDANQSGNEESIDEPEVNRVTAEDRFSEPNAFKYAINSANGITLTWQVNNLTGKTINYYNVKLSTFNPVGDPSYDEHSGKNTFKLRIVGPIEPDDNLLVFNRFTYQGALESIRIDEVELEYADGTKETVVYDRTTSDSSGLNAR